jgi:hypothetical protein
MQAAIASGQQHTQNVRPTVWEGHVALHTLIERNRPNNTSL